MSASHRFISQPVCGDHTVVIRSRFGEKTYHSSLSHSTSSQCNGIHPRPHPHHRQSHTKCVHGECVASGGLASISSSTGYEPNIGGNNSDAGMIAKNDHQSTTTERSRTSRPSFYLLNMERRWEIRIILFSMSNTHCLSKLRSGARRDAMLSIINEHASRMPLDNLSGLHATRDKLLWQGQ